MATTAEEIRLGRIAIRFLVEGAASGGAVAVFEFEVPRGAAVPGAHSHDGYEETIYGLEGTLVWTVDGARKEVGAGEALVIRRGKVHRFENEGDGDARALGIVTPGLLGPQYFRDVAAVLAAAGGGPPDATALAETMRRHGLTPAADPKGAAR